MATVVNYSDDVEVKQDHVERDPVERAPVLLVMKMVSHDVETLSLFGRIAANDGKSDLVDGYLFFPLEGVTLKMGCGRDIIHVAKQMSMVTVRDVIAT